MTIPTDTPRHVFLTAGARGIGEACLREMLSFGHNISVTYRNTKIPSDLLDSDRVFAASCDVSSAKEIEEAITLANDAFGPIEILIANAGNTDDVLLLRMSDEQWGGVLATNLTSAFHLTKKVLPQMMRARFGRVIYISSVVAAMGSPGQANYSAAKAGVIGFARSMTREVGSRNITFNVVAPGAIDTDMFRAASSQRVESITAQIPMRRLGTPQEVAGAVGFLASERASYINGAVLSVDGGLAMGL